jgi:hypothetical protein
VFACGLVERGSSGGGWRCGAVDGGWHGLRR